MPREDKLNLREKKIHVESVTGVIKGTESDTDCLKFFNAHGIATGNATHEGQTGYPDTLLWEERQQRSAELRNGA